MTNEWRQIADSAPAIQATKNQVLNPVVAELVQKYAKGKDLFDYGCGWGEFANLMQSSGFRVAAFDEADEMVARARSEFSTPTFLLKGEFEQQLPKLAAKYDVVVSNLVLCILESAAQEKMLSNILSLAKEDGVLIISFCHPKYDYLPDSLVSERIAPEGALYSDEFQYEKVIKENGIRFHDFHRPLEYYLELFKKYGLTVLETKESDTLGTEYSPDFIVFALSRS